MPVPALSGLMHLLIDGVDVISQPIALTDLVSVSRIITPIGVGVETQIDAGLGQVARIECFLLWNAGPLWLSVGIEGAARFLMLPNTYVYANAGQGELVTRLIGGLNGASSVANTFVATCSQGDAVGDSATLVIVAGTY